MAKKSHIPVCSFSEPISCYYRIRRAGAEKSGKKSERGKMGFASLILPVRKPPFVFCFNEFDCLLKRQLVS